MPLKGNKQEKRDQAENGEIAASAWSSCRRPLWLTPRDYVTLELSLCLTFWERSSEWAITDGYHRGKLPGPTPRQALQGRTPILQRLLGALPGNKGFE